MRSIADDDVSPAYFSFRFAVTIPNPRPGRKDRHRRLVERLREWRNEAPDYDERVGGLVSDLLEAEPLRFASPSE